MDKGPSEAEWRRLVVAYARVHGWKVLIAGTAHSDPGWPDLLLLRVREIKWIELKANGGQVSPAQAQMISNLRAARQDVQIWRPVEAGAIWKQLADSPGTPLPPPPNASTRDILNAVVNAIAHEYGLAVEDLFSPSRRQQVAFPRHIAMFIARDLSNASYPELGRFFRRDHTTILHGCRRIERDESCQREIAATLLPKVADYLSAGS